MRIHRPKVRTKLSKSGQICEAPEPPGRFGQPAVSPQSRLWNYRARLGKDGSLRNQRAQLLGAVRFRAAARIGHAVAQGGRGAVQRDRRVQQGSTSRSNTSIAGEGSSTASRAWVSGAPAGPATGASRQISACRSEHWVAWAELERETARCCERSFAAGGAENRQGGGEFRDVDASSQREGSCVLGGWWIVGERVERTRDRLCPSTL